jgi:hypothetical protein
MTALTKNERNMIFELAKGQTIMGDLLSILIAATPDDVIKTKLAELHKQHTSRLEEFMRLVHEEWLPK